MANKKYSITDETLEIFMKNSKDFLLWSYFHRSAVFNDPKLTLNVAKGFYGDKYGIKPDNINLEHDILRVNLKSLGQDDDVPASAYAKKLVKEITPN